MLHNYEIGVIGASGYAGVELCRVLATHPRVRVRFVTSDRWIGDSVRARTGIGGGLGTLVYRGHEGSIALAGGCAAVLLATPSDGSLALVPRLLEANARLVDLSGAFRLGDPSLYPRWYGFTHSAPHLLGAAVYGLPELGRAGLADARLVANPGCYATAAALALVPLLRDGLLAEESVVIDAASGVSGAGRRATESYSFCELDQDFRAYRVLAHQHTPEIAQSLGRAAGRSVPLTFTPHLLPVKRGILATASARLRAGTAPDALRASLLRAYAQEPFVEVVSGAGEVSIGAVVGTPRALVGVDCALDGFDPGRVVVACALDNLLKGAASQALQNLNLMLGLDERLGLVHERQAA